MKNIEALIEDGGDITIGNLGAILRGNRR